MRVAARNTASSSMIFRFHIFRDGGQCLYAWENQQVLAALLEPSAAVAEAAPVTPPPRGSSKLHHSASRLSLDDERDNADTATVPQTGAVPPKRASLNSDSQQKLVFGLVWTLRNMADKLTPLGSDPGEGYHRAPVSFSPNAARFSSFTTSHYRMHYFGTPTGLHFLLTTDPRTPLQRDALKGLYANVYTRTVVRNPLVSPRPRQEGKRRVYGRIDSPLFVSEVQKYLEGLPSFLHLEQVE